jgi:benzoate membrane transport protein
MEPGYSLLESIKISLTNINLAGIGAGFVAAIFSIMGPGVIVMNAAKQGGLSPAAATSWLFAIYMTGGLFTIYYALRYRLPLVAAYSIPGQPLLGKLLPL